ncbi:MAG TPA: DUF177 domain-containing protein [Xanthobacteraceae bacterium]|nr:DUF177 domain-containing protein [Xanthobacteraceae bacterium]
MNTIPWSVPVAVAEVPDTGRRFDLVADAITRAAIAKFADLPQVARLEAEFELTRQARNGLRVVGRVSATVEQTCVITLEPMLSEIEEDVDLMFVPASEIASYAYDDNTFEDDDPPELLQDGTVDLGAVATEFLVLGIDPYPRKPGSVFTPPQDDEAGTDHPFAKLAALKKPKPGAEGR